MNQDKEVEVILEDLPINKVDYSDVVGQTNAWISLGVSPTGKLRLEIFPSTGGWLGVDVELLKGDLAPFHG